MDVERNFSFPLSPSLKLLPGGGQGHKERDRDERRGELDLSFPFFPRQIATTRRELNRSALIFPSLFGAYASKKKELNGGKCRRLRFCQSRGRFFPSFFSLSRCHGVHRVLKEVTCGRKNGAFLFSFSLLPAPPVSRNMIAGLSRRHQSFSLFPPFRQPTKRILGGNLKDEQGRNGSPPPF